ncbi:hypothetical protein ACQPYK_25055 [Streptosporangium sp. CA-135522]|uniref:hypothetical protein n=1 Tax=Streptosporangium sp. CA-135522 TaxID=3240072 RepID=UPI003D90D7C4
MVDRTRARLVSTPDQAVNNYLRVAATMLVPQRTLEEAEASLTRAQENDRKHGGFHGTAEQRQHCERSYDKASQANTDAWRHEQAADAAARQGDPRAYRLAVAEVEAMWIDHYARRATHR